MQGSTADAKFFCPSCNALGFSVVGELNVVASIALLFFRRAPFDIAGFVIPVVVDSV